MDRMELKKRWLMGTVHPELFYLPWGHKKDKSIVLHKIDNYGNYVKGARLELDFNTNTDADKAVVSGADSLKVYINSTTSALELVTGGQPITIDNLLPGRYYLYELQAPNGYLQADSMGFVINSDGSITPNGTSDTVIVKNNAFELVDKKIHGIRFVVCFIDNPTSAKAEYKIERISEHAGPYSIYSGDNAQTAEMQRWHLDEDTIEHNKHEGIMAVKIYDNDEYIGFYAIVNLSKMQVFKGKANLETYPYFGTDNVGYNGNMPFPSGVTYSYANTAAFWTGDNINAKTYNLIWPEFASDKPPILPSRGSISEYDITLSSSSRSYTRHWHTEMEHMSPHNSYHYKNDYNCPFEPKPCFDSLGVNVKGDWYGDLNDRTAEITRSILAVSRRSDKDMSVSYREISKTVSSYVNLRKLGTVGDPTSQYNWEDRTETVKNISTDSGGVIIPVDLSGYSYKDYSDYDPNDTINSSGYVVYGDGLTAEKLAEYAKMYADNFSAATKVTLEFEN